MKRFSIIALLFIAYLPLFAQQPAKIARKKSWQTLIYRIPADTLARYITKDISFPNHYLNAKPYRKVLADSVDHESLPVGSYLILSVVENQLVYDVWCRSNLQLAAINNERRVQLEVKHIDGRYLDNATIEVNNKIATYSHETKSYWITQKKPDDAIVIVAVPGDTLVTKLSRKRYVKSGWSQWWKNFGHKLGRGEKKENTGYMVFNKPKYKPQDTVRFKAYLLNKRGKRYTETLDISLHENGRKYSLGSLKPTTDGAYVHEFVLGDSLRSDLTYHLNFYDKNKKKVFGEWFKVEDYLLDEVASYHLTVTKEKYYRKDTMVVNTSARDANGLAVMDGRVKIYAITTAIDDFYASRIYIPDTLWKGEKPLSVNGDTKFEIPLTDFPAADINIRIKAAFLNSNNELQERTENVSFKNTQIVLDVTQVDNRINASLIVDGKSGGKGWMKKSNIAKPIPVVFPYTEKVDPYTSYYYFYVKDEKGEVVATRDFYPGQYSVYGRRINNQDTAGILVNNPYKIPVYYTIYDGTRVVAKGGDSTENITWTTVLPAKKQLQYELQYRWAGEEEYSYGRIGVRDQEMETEIKAASTIYPGQTDTITVSVKDYKDRPAADVNLTAVSYNSQFNSPTYPTPPDLKKYRSRRGIDKPEYEVKAPVFSKHTLLGNYQGWKDKFGLDSMTYYNLLFPGKGYHVAHTSTSRFMPQLSVYVVKKGVPQKIHILYINRQPVYYDFTTDKSRYAFSAYPGYAQVIIRLLDREIQIDSVYLQPFYKHDVSFDLDSLPAHARVTDKPTSYTSYEKEMIENTTMSLSDDKDNTKYAWLWQDDKVVRVGDSWYHFIGPFAQYDSIQFFKPNDFDLKFPFEARYEYRLSPKMAKLKPSTIFHPKKKTKIYGYTTQKWIIGDTIINTPVIGYDNSEPPQLKTTGNFFQSTSSGKIYFKRPNDTAFIYGVVHKLGTDTSNVMVTPDEDEISVAPGLYELILVTSSFNYIVFSDIPVKAGQTFCIWNRPPVFIKSHALVEKLAADHKAELQRNIDAAYFRDSVVRSFRHSLVPGMGRILGRVIDAVGGKPVAFATVSLKGYHSSRLTDVNGEFVFDSIKAGNYVLQVSSIGYTFKEVWVDALAVAVFQTVMLDYSVNRLQSVHLRGSSSNRRNYQRGNFSVYVPLGSEKRATSKKNSLGMNNVSYEDVVVTGYGKKKKAGANKNTYMLGYWDDDTDGAMDGYDAVGNADIVASGEFFVHGTRGKRGEDVMGSWNDVDKIMKYSVSPDSAKAGSGKILRDQFRDYAIWQPNLFTDQNGNVQFTVTYPDNVTGWQTYVVGMDKKNRYTTGRLKVRSYKPLLAQLSGPQFLIAGDSVTLIGKTINYSAADNTIKNEFTLNGVKQASTDKQVKANSSAIEELSIKAGSDTLYAQYTVVSTEGFRDGELRTIPVFRKGIEETIGNFWILEKDTAFSFQPDRNAGNITIHAQNNTLDVLLDEINELKKYPYFCMEQIASKITGLVMEKKIRQVLNQPFKNEKQLVALLSRLQKSQTYEGGWSWWQGGEPNITITNYVARALLTVRNYSLVETNIRNAMLFLQNHLAETNRFERLATLYTMSEAGHQTGYAYELSRLSFDSLTVHEQWQYIRIKQNAKLDYKKELDIVMTKQIGTMLGGLHWGEDSYWWDRNRMATTVLAFKTLENDKARDIELKRMIQFFLEQRKKGRWTNTVESASIVSTILPTILKSNASFNTAASLRVNNSITATKFPFTTTIASADAPITINKSGGGLLYCTAYQEIFNSNPLPVTDKFNITTSFERNGSNIAALQAGEKVKMKVVVQVTADADYVQIEIPIPAGCTYGVKLNTARNLHTEYLKNKVVIFVEKMPKGQYNYEIELEPRYTGTYTLNPAKAELMYFPVFYGRNSIKEITVKK